MGNQLDGDNPPDEYVVDWASLDARQTRALVEQVVKAFRPDRIEPVALGRSVFSHVAIFTKKDIDGMPIREAWLVLPIENASHETRAIEALKIDSNQPWRKHLFRGMPQQIQGALSPDIPICVYVINLMEQLEPTWLRELRGTVAFRIRFLGNHDLENLVRRSPQTLKQFFSPLHVALKGQLEETRLALEEARRQQSNAERVSDALRLEQRRATKLERDAAWRDLANHICHKMGNPVSTIELIEGNLRGHVSAEGTEHLDDLASCLIKMNVLLSELRNFSKATGLELKPASIAVVVDILQSAIARVTLEKVEARLEVKGQLEALVALDVVKIAQCVDELLGNALYWTKTVKRPSITVTIQSDTSAPDRRSDLRILITDNGPGVPADQKERIFLPTVSFRTGPGSTGYGLAIVRKLIESHGGEITEIGGADEGACFCIELPVVADTRNLQ